MAARDRPGTAARLEPVACERLELRISLDGPNPEVNDPIRGPGSFQAALRGIKSTLGRLGIYFDCWYSEESLHRWGRVCE